MRKNILLISLRVAMLDITAIASEMRGFIEPITMQEKERVYDKSELILQNLKNTLVLKQYVLKLEKENKIMNSKIESLSKRKIPQIQKKENRRIKINKNILDSISNDVN